MREHLRTEYKASGGAGREGPCEPSSNGQSAETEKLIQKMQSLMWQHVGVVRDGKALQQVVPELRALQAARRQATGDRTRRPTSCKPDC